MMKTFPDFTQIAFDPKPGPVTFEQWRARFEAETGQSLEAWAYRTLE